MFERIGRIALPPWMPFAVITGVVVVATLLASTLPSPTLPVLRVAIIGNSMMYYNDFPRFLEAMADGHLIQNSCLHGDATLTSILETGNGMYNIWMTGAARVYNDDVTIFDYGACTVPQLLFGYDANLENGGEGNDDDYFTLTDDNNPCLHNQYYTSYLQGQYQVRGPPQWDFVLLNDNTRAPARTTPRNESLEILQDKYVSWFIETGATPVFMFTYGYFTPYRDMGGLRNVPEFTSLTSVGYHMYADVLAAALPASQQPRIAPVGLAFLTVYEENYNLWQRLFHVDKIHASPLGTYLQGCVVYGTLFDRMPEYDVVVRTDVSMLWQQARRFQPGEHRRSPFPTQEEAAYLYHIAVRVVRYGHVPKSFVRYTHGESADYTPQDDVYRIDDLF